MGLKWKAGKGRTPKSVRTPPEDPAVNAPPADVSRRGFLAGGVAGGVATAVASLFSRSAKAAPAAQLPIYRIHPSIGVARVGNADPSTYFIGPELPGQGPTGAAPGTAAPPYKVGGLIKPQAARFRVWEYQWVGGRLTPKQEVNLDTPGVLGITWQVHLANRKASFHKFNGPSGETAPAAGFRNATVADRKSLEIDFGPRDVDGRNQGPNEFSAATSDGLPDVSWPVKFDGNPAIDYLGQLRTDNAGRLIVLGGRGAAAYTTATPPDMPTYANNDGWFDDISDGPVTAVVTVDINGVATEVPMDAAGGGWCLVAPPDFAPRIGAAVSLYDNLFDLSVREIPIPAESALYDNGGPLERLRKLQDDFETFGVVEFPTYVPSFELDIKPILQTAYNYKWVTSLAANRHDSLLTATMADPTAKSLKARQKVFGYLRAPTGATAATGVRTMPKMLGDDPYVGQQPESVRRLTLTRTQFGLMRRWSAGNFASTGTPAPATTITPHGLDRAAMENACGGAFFPGIEVGWQIRNASLYIEPFRLNLAATSGYDGEQGVPLKAGHFSRQMAVPWQADFNDCRIEGNYAWWPSQRPDDVFLTKTSKTTVPWARADSKFAAGNLVSTHADMVALWHKFGIVSQSGTVFIETERAPTIP